MSETAARIQAHLDCLEPEQLEELNMFLEQAQMIVDAEEVDMAPDTQTMLDDYYVPVLDGAIEWCITYGARAEQPEGGDGRSEDEVP